MKGKISVFIIMMLMMIVMGCSVKENDSTVLTMDNYNKYLDVSTFCYITGIDRGIFWDIFPGQTGTDEWRKEIFYGAEVKGVSTNFNYNDVVVVLKVSGTYGTYALEKGKWVREDNLVDVTMEISTNIAGNGKDSQTISSTRWIHKDLVNIDIEVVSVSGTVTPAK